MIGVDLLNNDGADDSSHDGYLASFLFGVLIDCWELTIGHTAYMIVCHVY